MKQIPTTIRSFGMNVEIQEATFDEKSILRNLMELYIYDASEFEPLDVGAHGLFGYRWLDHYWTESDRYPFIVRADGKLAGFVLVRTLEESKTGIRSIAEFFILRRYRRQGMGRQVAHRIFDLFPGQWSVAQVDANQRAQVFWRKVISEYTQGNFQEIWSNNEEWKGPVQTFSTRANA
jgi:predicted acetyltransferase